MEETAPPFLYSLDFDEVYQEIEAQYRRAGRWSKSLDYYNEEESGAGENFNWRCNSELRLKLAMILERDLSKIK